MKNRNKLWFCVSIHKIGVAGADRTHAQGSTGYGGLVHIPFDPHNSPKI